MTYLSTVPPEESTGLLKQIYDREAASKGYVANHTRALSLRPTALAAWRALMGEIQAEMPPRRFELVTLAAARALRSSYCMLSHGSVLMRDHYAPEQLERIARDHRSAGLDAAVVALMDFATRITLAAHEIQAADIDALRAHGLSDPEILDVALTAAARNFYSKLLDAVGAEPDALYADLAPALREVLVRGRPIEATPPG